MKRIPARRAALLAAALVLGPSIVPSLGATAGAAPVAPSGRISGVVRDETGAVLAGAEVRLTTPNGPVAAQGTTDAAGRYSIATAAGLYDLTVAADDDAGPWTALVKNMSVWSDTPLDFAVVRPDAPVAPTVHEDPIGAFVDSGDGPGTGADVTWDGRVTGPGGAPVEPGEFSLAPSAGGPGGELEIGGADGSFTFTGPAGVYDLALATDLYPWGGGGESGPGDGLFLSGTADLTADRSDDLILPDGAPADVFVADVDGRKRTETLAYAAQRTAPVGLAPGVTADVEVSDTISAGANAFYRPLLFGRSQVSFTVPGDDAPVGVAAALESGDRLAIVIGDRRSRPGAPRDVEATPLDGRVRVTWEPPLSDGGSPITDYVITASSGGSHYQATARADATQGSVRNLINGTEYAVTVTARNAKGGTASAPVMVTPQGSGQPDPGDGGDPVDGGDPLGGAGSGGDGPGTAPQARFGYWLLGADGSIHPFGDAAAHGDASAALAAQRIDMGQVVLDVSAVDVEATPSGRGYWILDGKGRIHPFGDAPHLGDVPVTRLSTAAAEMAVSLSATPTGAGYWVFTNRGRVFSFGDAAHLGDMAGTTLNEPVLDSVATPSGRGYYMVAHDGGVFAFGDARFAGSMGGRRLNAAVRSLVPDGDGSGYWLVAVDGGVFAFDAPFRGSMGGERLNAPMQGMVRYGDGYLMVGMDGGVFNFSDRPFTGSLGARPPATRIVSVAAIG